MNKRDFEHQYNEALIKTAIGVHIIESAGKRVGLEEKTMEENIAHLCKVLADGLGLDPMSVVNDVMVTLQRLPSMYLSDPRLEQYIRDLEKDYDKQMEAQNKMLEAVDI